MKIYNRKDFLELPEGTFFAKGCQWVIEGFCIKGETWKSEFSDFLYHDLVSIEYHDSIQHFDRLEEMLEKGVSYPINDSISRDGSFNGEDVFLVFERQDLLEIKKLIDLSLRAM